jgi:hypothetical protein
VVTTTAQATADSFGSFTLYNLPAGVVLINALSADGSAVGSATVIVPANGRLSGVGILLSSGPPPPP